MKNPVRVAVTGAAGQIGYALLFRIASGEMLGKDQPVILQMLELPMEKARQALKGVMMELEDCAFPLLAGMVGADDPKARSRMPTSRFLVGAKPRGPGMERKDLLLENAKIFIEQGKALECVCHPQCQGFGGGQSGQYQRLHRDEDRRPICCRSRRTSPRCFAWIIIAHCPNSPLKHRQTGRRTSRR